MEALQTFSLSFLPIPKLPNALNKPTAFTRALHSVPNHSFLSQTLKPGLKTKLFTTLSSSTTSTESTDPPEPEVETHSQDEKFDWFSHWYPLMPVCDLDKREPHAKRVMGLDVVIWWDRNENAWKVFDDLCPHRLAPLSEGRIDQWGRLQCVYHGWCFDGAGDCKFIPQAPPDGPPVHTFKKACVAAYPITVQNGILWFWPNSDPKYKDIMLEKQPPYFPELDDPSYTQLMGNRDIPYGYEILIENLMDPAHVPYAHYGIMRMPKPKKKADREGGRPLEMKVEKLGINGFFGKQEWGSSEFIPPCVYYVFPNLLNTQSNEGTQNNGALPLDEKNKVPGSQVAQRRAVLIFICIPVSPGKSRLIWTFPRNFAVWMDKIVPRWFFHIGQNLILDSDLYLLHIEERKIMEVGPSQWQKACFVPTKSDAYVVGFRKWLNKYSNGLVDWRGKFTNDLPPTPPREQLMDRYWTHVVNCQSCNNAYKGLNALEVLLQVVSIASIAIVAATKNGTMTVQRNALVCAAVLCFAASRWLSHFIYKTFHYHDYNHALR